MGEGDAVFSARVLECAKGWLEHWPPECLRAVLGDAAPPSRSHGAEADDADVDVDAALADALLVAARRAAPAILALERLVAERRTRCDGASTTVVELCGASRGHVLGAFIASMKIEGVAEVVIVDNRWPRTGAGDDASRDAAAAAKSNTLPTSHMDAADGWWTSQRAAPPHRWKASLKNASHLRSLNAALRRARIAIGESSGISIVANGVGGTGELRALQLYHAPYGIRTRDSTTDADDTTDQDVSLVLLPGDPPERDEACRRNLLYRAGPTHEFAVKRLWPRRDRRDPAGPSIETYAKTAWTAHLAAGAGGEVQTLSLEVKTSSTSVDGCHDESPPLVLASRASALELGAPSGNRTLDDAFGPVALTVVEQLAAVNAEVLRRLGSADIGVLGDDLDLSDNSCPIALRRVEPGRWTSGGYCEHHYVPEPPGPHGLCFEAFTRTTDSSEETNKNYELSVPVGFIALTAYGDDDHDRDEYPLTDDDDTKMGKYNAKPGGTLTGAQVDRLCVLPGARGRGVKERLLRCADGFHSVGLPVRVKTASRTAAESFVRCPLLAYDGFKDPTKAGVSKRRGTKTVVVVDGEDGGKIKNAGEDRYDPRRYEDDWRERSPSVPRSIPVTDDSNTRHPTAERDPASATRAALNRAAPDTVAACVDKIAAALRVSGSSGESSGTISPETLAAADLIVKRGAKEPSFRAVYADIARGVASKVGCEISNSFADAITKSTLAPFQTRCAPGKGGTLLAGHAVFAAELHHRGSVTAEDVAAVARRLAEGADVEVAGDSGVDSATCVPALCALVDALDAAATAALGDETTGLVRDVLGRVEDGISHDMGGRARFLAGRASLTLSSARVESHLTTRTNGGGTKGFGMGRGKARAMDARAMTRAEVHASARAEMRMEVVQSGSTRAVDRGMRRGWTFAYVGSPVQTRGGSNDTNADLIRVFTPSEAVTDPAVLTEEAGSHRKGRYEWVPASVADEREWPSVGLPRIKFVGESF